MAMYSSGNGFILGGNNNAHDASTGAGTVKSGVNLDRQGNFAKLRQDFVSTLTINPDKCTESNIEQYAKQSGELKADNALYAEESKQRLAVGREQVRRLGIGFSHLNGVAALNQQWEQTVANGIQQLEMTQLKSMVTESQHDGFASKLNRASKLIAI